MTKANERKFYAGGQTALADARRGSVSEPLRTDDPSWAAGYREMCADLAAEFGPHWQYKMVRG